jgi:hypothetical protein
MRSLLSAACLLALSGCAIIVNGSDDVQVKTVFSSDAVVGDGRLAHERRSAGSVSGSGRITVYGSPAQRSVSGKNVLVLN